MANWGIPYQGSKGAHAHRIFRAIAQRTTGERHLFDPFCGGFAVSHYFLAHGWSVTASDADCYQIALLEALLNGDGVPELMDAWIPRPLFEQCRDDPDSTGLSDAEVQFVRLVWSFGNSGTSYLYGQPLEEVKRLTHELIVEGSVSARLAELSGVSERVQRQVVALPARSRYTGWRRAYTASGGKDFSRKQSADRDRSARVAALRDECRLQSWEAAGRVSSSFDGANRMYLDCCGYEEALANLAKPATIYLDPPYEGTETYSATGTFDHGKFWTCATALARRGHSVYVSEYNAPPDWKPILSFSRPNQMAADPLAKTRHHREKLFTHRAIE